MPSKYVEKFAPLVIDAPQKLREAATYIRMHIQPMLNGTLVAKELANKVCENFASALEEQANHYKTLISQYNKTRDPNVFGTEDNYRAVGNARSAYRTMINNVLVQLNSIVGKGNQSLDVGEHVSKADMKAIKLVGNVAEAYLAIINHSDFLIHSAIASEIDATNKTIEILIKNQTQKQL